MPPLKKGYVVNAKGNVVKAPTKNNGNQNPPTNQVTTNTNTQPTGPVMGPQDFAAQYGVQAALVNSDPQLKALFDQAVAEKWSSAKFQAAFVNTNWYKTHSDNWRVAETTRTSDPASWQEQLNLAADSIRRKSVELGFELDPKEVDDLARQSLYMAGGTAGNVNDTWLKTQVVQMGVLTGKGGTALQTIDSLKKIAYNNGVDYGDTWFEAAAKDTLMGTGTISGWEKQIKDAAKSKYAALAEQLDAGMTVRDIASPYIQQMASTLETDVNTITLDDPLMQRALTGLDESGKPFLTPLWKFQQELKQDDRYFKTNKANQDFMGLASSIARQFGRTV